MSAARHYAREIETRWAELLDRPVVLGERDWSLICDWQARGIPLALVAEAIEALSEKLARRRSKPRNLGALAPLVEEAWRAVRGGRIEASATTTPAPLGGDDRLASWRRCAEALPREDTLRGWIEGLIARVGAGESLEACERALTAGLIGHLPEQVRDEITRSVEANLAGFRSRMEPATWVVTRDRALVSAARRKLGLPCLTNG